MNPTSIVESVEEERQTELQRLGSSRLLIALTGADLAAETVLGTVAARGRVAREVFDSWAEGEADERAREVFEAAAVAQAEAYDRILAELDDEESNEQADPFGGESNEAVDPFGGTGEEFSDAVERAGGLLGWALVADRVYAQAVGFFVNEAAPARTELFRDLREDVGAVRDDAAELLAAVCESDADRERAAAAAGSVVRGVYDDYAATLEGMGLDPKPVC